jgi:hypothetical protein
MHNKAGSSGEHVQLAAGRGRPEGIGFGLGAVAAVRFLDSRSAYSSIDSSLGELYTSTSRLFWEVPLLGLITVHAEDAQSCMLLVGYVTVEMRFLKSRLFVSRQRCLLQPQFAFRKLQIRTRGLAVRSNVTTLEHAFVFHFVSFHFVSFCPQITAGSLTR